LSIVVYILSDVSGAHINPAVTVGLAATKQFPAKKVLPYIVTQILGATFAAVMLRLIFGNTAQLGSTVLVNETSVQSGFMIEAILTLFLVFVVISSYKVSKSIVGFLIGGTLAADILLAGSLTMCSVNPARSLGPAIVSGTLTNQWLYIVAPLVGAVIAALLWKGLGEAPQE
jgi:MIP family channel proteins